MNQISNAADADGASIDLSQLADAARFQLATAKSAVDVPTAEIQLPEGLQMDAQEGSLENVLLCTDLSTVAVDVQQGQVEQLPEDPNESYVDVKIKEGQIIRLKVPFNIDPVAYATEYLQQALNDEDLA